MKNTYEMKEKSHWLRHFIDNILMARWSLMAVAAFLIIFIAKGNLSVGEGAFSFCTILGITAFFSRHNVMPRKSTLREQSSPSSLDHSMTRMANALPDPCFLLDGQGIVLYRNSLAKAAFANVRANDPLLFILRAPSLVAAINRVVSGGPSETTEFVEHVPTDSWFEAHMVPLHKNIKNNTQQTNNQTPEFVILILRNVTEQRKLDRMRADFVANASHELRTPLASLYGFIETLEGAARDDIKAQKKFLSIMRGQAERMSRLIDDLLSLSHIEMRSHMRPNEQVDLNEIVRHVVDVMTLLAHETGIEINLALDHDTMFIAGDRDELIQVFNNLVENAIKYGRDGKIIYITSHVFEEDDQYQWCISIRDHGPGIATEHLPRLTERFYRVDVEESRAQKGTGLGLAIVKHIVARHRGELKIDSNLGHGAIFSVYFDVWQ